MNIAEIISTKRDGEELTPEQVEFLVAGYAKGKVPDYQMAAFAMAVFFQGMTPRETTDFTRAMVESGVRMDWGEEPPSVDKHSTGGIGDKISIPLAPMLACCGVQVPMISGRGLGTTGGTLDKLESIPGYRSEVSDDQFRSIVHSCGCSIASATASLAPADKRLYALRDVTGTVPSIPLITASILSKKIAEGIDALVLDVKWGTGAFMKTLEDAQSLAQSLVQVGRELGVATSAVISDMNQPLGRMIGNAVEIDESVDVLKGQGPADVRELTIHLGAKLLVAAGVVQTSDEASARLVQTIETGQALEKFDRMVTLHGGDLQAPRKIGNASSVKANRGGIVQQIDASRLGLAIIEMGGGRKQLGDSLDHSAGIEFLVRIGDTVEPGQEVAKVFCDNDTIGRAAELVEASIDYGKDEIRKPQLIVESI